MLRDSQAAMSWYLRVPNVFCRIDSLARGLLRVRMEEIMKFDCPRCYAIERLGPCKLRPLEYLLLPFGFFPVRCEGCQFRTLRSFVLKGVARFFGALSNFDEVVDSFGEAMFWHIGSVLNFFSWLLFGLPLMVLRSLFARLFGDRPEPIEPPDTHHVVDGSANQAEPMDEFPGAAKSSQVTWPPRQAVRKVLEGETVSHVELAKLLAHHMEPQRNFDQDSVQS